MKRLAKSLIWATGLCLVALILWAGLFLRNGERAFIQSDVLDESRSYTVFLPNGYDSNPDKLYPVIYSLDGEKARHGKLFAANARMMAVVNLGIEAIIVAVHSEGVRTRDFAPSDGAERFSAFLGRELVPAVEAKFRTSGYSVLYGHSYGGLYAVYARAEKPELFDSHIAIVPSFFHAPAFVEKLRTDQFDYQPFGKLYFYTGIEGDRFWNSYNDALPVLQKMAAVDSGSFPLPHSVIMLPGQMSALRALKD